jgi:hypothetical protein
VPTQSRGTRSSNPVPSSGESAANLGPKRSNGGSRKILSPMGTDGSNPSPSSAVSRANQTSSEQRIERPPL